MKNVYSYIRWSTERQNFGDSERRQEQLAKDWCARRGLKLSERTFTDRGTSAFKGKNKTSGKLGELLKIVNKDDCVVVEDNDRFSREDVLTALSSLRDIVVNKGVTVVFLKTGVEVTKDNFNERAMSDNAWNRYVNMDSSQWSMNSGPRGTVVDNEPTRLANAQAIDRQIRTDEDQRRQLESDLDNAREDLRSVQSMPVQTSTP